MAQGDGASIAAPAKQSYSAQKLFERRLAQAKRINEQMKPKWREMYRAYRALPSTRAPQKKDWQTDLRTPYIYQQIETLLPRYMDPNPGVLFNPLHPMYAANVRGAQYVVNDELDADNYAVKQYGFVQPMGIFGESWIKTAWLKDQRLRTRRNTLEAIAAGGPVTIQAKETYFDGPTARVRSVFNMMVEPGATELDEAGWVIEQSYTTMSRLQRQRKRKDKAGNTIGIYSNLDSVPTGKARFSKDDGLPNISSEEKAAFEAGADVLLYEMWEPTANRALVFANGTVIFDGEYPWDHGMFPYARLLLTPDTYSWNTISPTERMSATQEILHLTDNQRLDDSRLAMNGVMGYTDNVDDINDMQVEPGAWWGPFNQNDVFPIERPSTQQIGIQEQGIMRGDLQGISGIQPSIGAPDPSGQGVAQETATGTLAVMHEQNKRLMMGIVQVNYRGLQRIGLLFHELNQQFMTTDRWVQTNASAMERFTPDQVTGKYRVSVRAADDDVVKQMRFNNDTQLLQVMQPYAAAPGPDGTVFNPKAVLADVAEDRDWDPQELWIPVPPPPPPQGAPGQDGGGDGQIREQMMQDINYKDAPEDLRRQMEAKAGYTPSQMGGNSVADSAQSAPRALVTQMANQQATTPQQPAQQQMPQPMMAGGGAGKGGAPQGGQLGPAQQSAMHAALAAALAHAAQNGPR